MFVSDKEIRDNMIKVISNQFLFAIIFCLFSCTSGTKETELIVTDLELKLKHENLIDLKLSQLGIIDITALTNENTIGDLNLKVAKTKFADENFTLILLDKNGNGKHNDYNIDLLALAPNNWSVLNARRFLDLNFFPFQVNNSINIYKQFNTVIDINEDIVTVSKSTPSDTFHTFPYRIPELVRTTINETGLDFRELTKHNKLIFFEFWGTWCKPCVEQIPDLIDLNEKFDDKLLIVGINSNDDLLDLKSYVTKRNMNWIQIQMDEELSKSFGEVFTFPLGILFDQYGKLISYGIKPKDIIKVLDKQDR